MSENTLILLIMLVTAVAILARRHYLQHRRERLVRDFLADPERKKRQGEV